MNRTAHQYAEAFVSAQRDGGESATLIANLLKTVDKHNDRRKLPSITAIIEKLLIKARGGSHITVTSARALTPERQSSLHQLAGAHDVVTFVTDASLVAGMTITKDQEHELDYSFAGALGHLFN